MSRERVPCQGCDGKPPNASCARCRGDGTILVDVATSKLLAELSAARARIAELETQLGRGGGAC